ncbi:hypothetical protein PVT67_06985 [Gallaecimonas kandeliae]|uniref:hypothetical protein n=1 Tax=Gallaecimonas kandeliae TaxID=3029055 RepID=UPI002649B553|nr:hypothetical protein [Gallaecimonas kandeliae]WKE66974.1 hypothetical protein PVT67_06985 [Gallaecimonas kandeliae]
MVKLLFVTILLCSFNLDAAWTRFERIIPANMKEKGLDIHFEKSKGIENYRIWFNDEKILVSKDIIGKSAWLVLSKEPIAPKNQDLRGFFDSYYINQHFEKPNPRQEMTKAEEKEFLMFPKISKQIVMTTKISEEFDGSGSRFFEAVLDPSVIKRSYIYVGPSVAVADGGLFYTIDINSFYEEYRHANKRRN